MSASPKQKRLAIEEALFFCARPECFNESGIDVHHINGVRTDHKPDNLIALCATCHQARYHRSEVPLSQCIQELQAYRRALQSFVPGRERMLCEVLRDLHAYYESGEFRALEQGICVLVKSSRREQSLATNRPLIARLNEYRGEIAIQRGRGDKAGPYLERAALLLDSSSDQARASHCCGLRALQRVQCGDFEGAFVLFDKAAKMAPPPGTHDEAVLYGLQAWLSHLRASAYRKLGEFDHALRHLDLAGKKYGSARCEIDKREAAAILLERVKVMISSRKRTLLSKAYDAIEGVERRVEEYCWPPERASLAIQKFHVLKALGDDSLASLELKAAWDRATVGDATHRVREILEIVAYEPAYCLPSLRDVIVSCHGTCSHCSGRPIQEVALCQLRRMFAMKVLEP